MDDTVKSILEGIALDKVDNPDEGVYEGSIYQGSILKESDRGNFFHEEKWLLSRKNGSTFEFTTRPVLYPEEWDREEWGPSIKHQTKQHFVRLGLLEEKDGYPTLRGSQDDRRSLAEKITEAVNSLVGRIYTVGLRENRDGDLKLTIRRAKK